MVVQIYPKCLCIYGFVNKFWTGRIFERLRKVCGGSNLSTVLLLWGIYIKKCISLVRICLQTENARNASTKFRKTLESKKAEKSLEISAFLVFSCLHLNQTLIMAGVAGFEPAKMPESKSGALPLGYTPIFEWPLVLYHILFPVSRTFFAFLQSFCPLFWGLLRFYIFFVFKPQNLGKFF